MVQNDASVSFIVPCYRNLRTVGFTLRSILAQEGLPDSEVFLIDSSEESVVDWLKIHFPGVRLIRPGRRLWAGAARNLGAAQAGGKLLAFVDADAVLQSNWTATLRRRLLETSDVVATGGYVENANPGTLASRVLHWAEFSEFLPGAATGFRKFLSSSNLLMRRASFLEVGGFPEELPASEDRVLFHRLVGRGRVHAFWDGSTGVQHYHRSRWPEALKHLYHLGYWGGRVRRQDAAMPGGALARTPAAALLLPFYRAPLVASRVCRAQPRRTPGVLVLSPLLFVALSWWARGFRAGLTDGPDPSGQSGG